ncbi:hypothetical protein E9549_05300 [Blastococcus sp. MG754426]|uniref:hypothetical protein n=1 Tax=unclassified Blastococcus TaxID=2619396 RepID=UPI001EF13681|nr:MULTISPECIES: hypothetical protein [unclassified Blastococcus]MCF6506824.1 hypothetical protein [Blastococcus sp. MG754426]MCF6511624.1 hypothetical protein [Blastococcus sp. MG754427]
MSRPRDWSPLRPSDPVGGDAGAVARLARQYAGTAAAITTAATALREIHGSATVWDSGAGRAFRERTAEVAGTIEQALARYEGTAAALAGYARALEDVQARADVVLARAREAEEARDAAWRARERAAAQPEPDPVAERRAHDDAAAATGGIRAAGEELASLEAEWRAAGETAADAVDDVLGADDLADGFWDDVLDVIAVVTGWAGKVAGALGLAAFLLGAIPGLQPFAAPFAALALAAGAVSLVGNTVLLASGRAGLDAVLWDVAGVLTFGAGRAFALAGRAVATGTRGLARPSLVTHLRGSGMTRREARAASRVAASPGPAAGALTSRARDPRGWLPTRGEWAEAYRRSGLWRDPVAGPPTFLPTAATAAPQVQTGLSRVARAEGACLLANAAGTVPAANAFAGSGGPAPARAAR